MKTFTATHLNKHSKEVFHAAKEDGSVVIEHYGYLGGVFAIVWNADMSEEEMLKQIREGDMEKEASAMGIMTVNNARSILGKHPHEDLTINEFNRAKLMALDLEDK